VTAVQPDLFGEDDAREAERAVWLARFERRDFPAPYATGTAAEGDIVHGWVCPACGDVEWGAYQLVLNHGFDPHIPGRSPWGAEFGESCHRLRHQQAQAEGAAARAEFEAATEGGRAAPAPWGGAPCKACGEMMRHGDLVVRLANGKGCVHERCAP
jgi:hypothetical protein